LVPQLLSSATVQKHFQSLLRPCASRSDGAGILGALAEGAPIMKVILLLREYVPRPFRSRVVRHSLEPLSDPSLYLLNPLQRMPDMVAA
jgi:hypothetical protein